MHLECLHPQGHADRLRTKLEPVSAMPIPWPNLRLGRMLQEYA